MKKGKKILALLLVFAFAACISSCGSYANGRYYLYSMKTGDSSLDINSILSEPGQGEDYIKKTYIEIDEKGKGNIYLSSQPSPITIDMEKKTITSEGTTSPCGIKDDSITIDVSECQLTFVKSDSDKWENFDIAFDD